MEPWQSWGIVGIVAVGAYWYYSNQHKSKSGRGRVPVPSQQGQRPDSLLGDEPRGRRKRANNSGTSSQVVSDAADVSSASAPPSGTDRLKNRKGGKKQPSQLAQSSAVEVRKEGGADNDFSNAKESDIDNKEFARQLASLKTGTSLNRPSSINETQRTRKQGKRNEMPSEPANGAMSKNNGLLGAPDMSTASSTTGADADDDLSPAMSPEFGATQSTEPAGGVSDMLEAPTKGPSVLRLTEPAVTQAVRQPKPQKQAQEPETKKQRQNRQKNEEKKLLREQAEKERRVLFEKQLRAVREAEGRPAKNGMASSKPPTNAWSKSADSPKPTAPEAASSHDMLLDTFDEPTAAASNSAQRYTGGMSATQKAWNRDLPSEEEQMRILNEMDNDGWNTVEKTGKGKKKATAKTEEPQKAIPVNSEKQTKSFSDKPLGVTRNTTMTGNSSAKRQPASLTSLTSTPKPGLASNEPKGEKVTKEDIDPNIWNHSNIHNHPDYDPELPYALTGHPDDDEWAVV